MATDPATAARRCSSCGRVRAECRTPDQPFLSCCNDCRANDGDTHSAPKGEVCTGPCDHDKHERRGPTWFGWYEPATAADRFARDTPDEPFDLADCIERAATDEPRCACCGFPVESARPPYCQRCHDLGCP